MGLEILKTVSVNPSYVRSTIDVGIVFSAGDNRGVFLNGYDMGPTVGESKRDGVAASASE